MASTNGFNPPFPALTTSQRYHLEVFGYVVVEDMLSPSEIKTLYDALHALKDEFMAGEDPWNSTIRGATIGGKDDIDNRVVFGHLLEAHPVFLEHAAKPRIVGCVEEALGQRVRVVEQAAYINSRNPDAPYEGPGRYLWHRINPDSMTYRDNGLTHSHFAKTLTNLTDLGPDDGGTCVIAGSHKIDAPEEAMVKAARENPDLIHQVTAPAGSTLVFYETLLHATGDITSDRERTIIINGYKPWNVIGEYKEFSDEFRARLPEELEPLIYGTDLNPRMRRRPLGADPGTLDTGEHWDGWSLETADPNSYEANSLSRRR